VGYGNVTALCTPCDCHPVGSKSNICDQQTGLCECRKGVDGFHCDTCQNLHYGLSEDGCKGRNYYYYKFLYFCTKVSSILL
jgi:laminin alpha 1/2